MIKKTVIILLIAAIMAVIFLAFQPAPVGAQEETPTLTPTSTPTETPAPTITPVYVYERVITTGDTFSINAQVMVGLIQSALLLVIIFLLAFRRVK
jgi:hypothetical protein